LIERNVLRLEYSEQSLSNHPSCHIAADFKTYQRGIDSVTSGSTWRGIHFLFPVGLSVFGSCAIAITDYNGGAFMTEPRSIDSKVKLVVKPQNASLSTRSAYTPQPQPVLPACPPVCLGARHGEDYFNFHKLAGSFGKFGESGRAREKKSV
jgi:hypothetical protein